MNPTPEANRGRRARTLAQVILTLLGCAGLVWFALQVDWSATRDLLLRLGGWLFLLPVPYLLVYLADTTGWLQTFHTRPAVPWLRLFRIRWAGEAVNNVIPSAYIGGEALKVLMLRRHGVPGPEGTTAAVLSKSLQSVAQLLFLSLASVAFLSLGTAPPGFAKAVAAVLIGGITVLTGWFLLQRLGLFTTLVRLIRRLRLNPGRWLPKAEHLREVDEGIRRFHSRYPGRFFGSITAYLAGWVLDASEIYLVGQLLDLPISWRQAIAVEAFTGVAKAVAVLVPGAIGIQESSIVFLCRMAGVAEPLGTFYALLRRAREVLFAAIGWQFLLLEQVSPRDLKGNSDTPGAGTPTTLQ
ncbi:MAG: flippase-like domain-containing protein [Verrucomicrobiales bacterium]|nr:flippase-like domain-containing protein [Verrucomicrobiales bacterium]